MPTIKPKHATTSEILQRFGGIGAASPTAGHACSHMQNFRILDDGTLEKRCGFRKKYTFSDTVRGFWEGFIDGVPLSCAVAGDGIYIRQPSGSFLKKTSLSTISDPVQFVSFRNFLYLLDGKQIYVYLPELERFQLASGYVPLIGYNWNPTSLGGFHEPVNLISNQMRIHYKNPDGSLTYSLPFSAQSIDSIVAEGRHLANYTFAPGSSYFSVSESYSWLEICFTATVNTQNAEYIHQCTQAVCERLEDQDYLFLFGNNKANYIFGTYPVTEDMLSSCRAACSLADPLYCPVGMQVAAGTATNPITTIYRQRNRLLAFHGNGALSLQVNEHNQLFSYPLLTGYGCTAKLPYLTVGDNMVIINLAGIFLISSDSSDPDQFSVRPISSDIPELKTSRFARNADVYYDIAHEELWFCDKTNPETIFVYHVRKKIWYTFSGFMPSFFLTSQGSAGFASEKAVYLFEDMKNDDDGSPIIANLTTGYLFVSSPETPKRATRITLLASCGNNRVDLALKTESGSIPVQFYEKEAQSFPVLYDRRIEIGRFRLLQIVLTDTGEHRTRIYRLAVFANS